MKIKYILSLDKIYLEFLTPTIAYHEAEKVFKNNLELAKSLNISNSRDLVQVLERKENE